MKTVTLAALAFLGASFAMPLAFAAPLHPGTIRLGIMNVAPDEFSGLVQLASKNSKKKHNYNHGSDFIPGYVLTPYGHRDCIGWWHRHKDGRLHCHGQLIKPH